MAFKLKDYQREATLKIIPGSIVCGDTGSGKTLTSIAYYLKFNGINIDNIEKEMVEIINEGLKKKFKKLYIITTPKKRDDKEWEIDLAKCLLSIDDGIVIDSWNNIKKYKDVNNSFFIFDEQRVTGAGPWVKAFLNITRNNIWILLSATPGDTYMDYLPVFLANGFYKNRTEFIQNHVIYNRFCKYPKIDKYINTEILDKYRDKLLIPMNYERKTNKHYITLECEYDHHKYKDVVERRWNIFEDKPIQTASEFCKVLRTINNSDISRLNCIRELYKKHDRLIVFYNYDFELEKLLSLKDEGIIVTQWNGHRHENIDLGDKWIHVVQYLAGNEGWNCIETNAMAFYSNNYSYRIMKQSSGRIDRMNTPYKDLYYYSLVTKSSIERSILNALELKKEFNEKSFSANFGIQN